MTRKSIIFFSFLFYIKISLCQEINHRHISYYSFIENKGQWGNNILFKSKFEGGNLWIEQGRFLFHMFDFL